MDSDWNPFEGVAHCSVSTSNFILIASKRTLIWVRLHLHLEQAVYPSVCSIPRLTPNSRLGFRSGDCEGSSNFQLSGSDWVFQPKTGFSSKQVGKLANTRLCWVVLERLDKSSLIKKHQKVPLCRAYPEHLGFRLEPPCAVTGHHSGERSISSGQLLRPIILLLI